LNNGPATRGTIAAVFDLTRPASVEALRSVVGEENVARFAQQRRVKFVLRDLAPELEEILHQATRDLALEGPQGPA
jgi:hypothetical protein